MVVAVQALVDFAGLLHAVLENGDLLVVAGDLLLVVIGKCLAQEVHAVIVVIDLEVGIQSNQLAVLSEKPHAERVERPYHDAAAFVSYHPNNPVLHLLAGLVGERDGKNAVRLDLELVYCVGDLGCYYSCLSASGSGEYKQGTFVYQDGLALLFVQLVHQFLHAHILTASRSTPLTLVIPHL